MVAQMNNEPVALMTEYGIKPLYEGALQEGMFLYTHPAKTLDDENRMRFEQGEYWSAFKCLDREGVPTEDEGGVLSLWGRICKFAHPAKTLTDEEITAIANDLTCTADKNWNVLFARAILRKAQEK